MTEPVHIAFEANLCTITMNDPLRRNALGIAMFDALQQAVDAVTDRADVSVVMIRGEGKAFCAGFDLAAAVDDDAHARSGGAEGLMAEFIHRLSRLNRSIRRAPQVMVAAVQGAALAGGCAMLSACDFVVVAPDASLGYPVHRIGVSPAVTLPFLRLAMGDGPARALVLSGDLIDGHEAKRLALATHLAASADSVLDEARSLCLELSKKGAGALRATKVWLNELDGSIRDEFFDLTAHASAALTEDPEAKRMLAEFWSKRGAR